MIGLGSKHRCQKVTKEKRDFYPLCRTFNLIKLSPPVRMCSCLFHFVRVHVVSSYGGCNSLNRAPLV